MAIRAPPLSLHATKLLKIMNSTKDYRKKMHQHIENSIKKNRPMERFFSIN